MKNSFLRNYSLNVSGTQYNIGFLVNPILYYHLRQSSKVNSDNIFDHIDILHCFVEKFAHTVVEGPAKRSLEWEF